MTNDVRLVDVVEDSGDRDLPGGSFSSWLRHTRSAMVNNGDIEVSCGECNACCRSSYFVHIDPRETDTLEQIPEELLFDAPGWPKGHVVMGYGEDGCCPMLIDNRCSIYEHRPKTCRNFDCRIFAAAGISVDDEDKASIRHSMRWKFDYAQEQDRVRQAAVQTAAEFLRDHSECFEAGVPRNATQLAMFAIKVHEVFLNADDDHPDRGKSDLDLVAVVKAILES